MYHEILFALLGLTGDVVVLSEDPVLHLPTFRVKEGYSLLKEAEREQINQILPLGWYYQQFQHFQAQYNLTWNLVHAQLPVYKMALACAVQDLLSEYEESVNALEELFNRSVSDATDGVGGGNLSYNTFLIELKNYSIIFPHLYRMLLTIEAEGVTGCALLDYFAKCPIGNPILQEAIHRILYRLRTVLLKQVFAWMMFGDLQDESKEFFIQTRDTSSSSPSSSSSSLPEQTPLPTSYAEQRMLHHLSHVRQRGAVSGSGSGSSSNVFEWSSSYLLRLERLPDSHISPNLASKILFTGKAILLLQQSQAYSSQNSRGVGRGTGLGKGDSTGLSTKSNVFRYLSQGHSFHHSQQQKGKRGEDDDDDDEEEDSEDDEEDEEDKDENENKGDNEEKRQKKDQNDSTSLLLGFSKEEIEYLDGQFHALLLLHSTHNTTTTNNTPHSTPHSNDGAPSLLQFVPSLEALLNRVYNVISNRLWRYMQEEHGFLHYLHIIRNTYLLGKGEFFQNILDEIYPLSFPAALHALHSSSTSSTALSSGLSVPSIEEMDELLNWKILRNATKLIGLDDDDMLHSLQLNLDFSSLTIQRFNQQNLHYFTRNGCCEVEYPSSTTSTTSTSTPLGIRENLYEALSVVFNVQHPAALSTVFMRLWGEKNQLTSMYLYNTLNNPWNPNHLTQTQPSRPSVAGAGAGAGADNASMSAPLTSSQYLNGSMWLKDPKFVQKGFQCSLSFQCSWINVNRHLTSHHPYFTSSDHHHHHDLQGRRREVVLGSVAVCLQNDGRGVNAVGKGELSRDILSSILIGASFHGFIEEKEEEEEDRTRDRDHHRDRDHTSSSTPSTSQRVKYYARIYVARGSLEGSWKLPTDRHVSLHIGATTNHTASAHAPAHAHNPTSTSSSTLPAGSTSVPADYILAEKIVDLDQCLQSCTTSTSTSQHLKSLSSFDKMRLEVEYVRALQYQQQQPPTTSSTTSLRSAGTGGGGGGGTIFSEYQRKVQLTGDVTYRLRVRLTNEQGGVGAGGGGGGGGADVSWDLELPIDLTLYVKLAGGQCHVGTVTSGLHFPAQAPAPAHATTIDQMHPFPSPSKSSEEATHTKTATSSSSSSSSAWEESFHLRLSGLSFLSRSNVSLFPICSPFTATRFPATQLRLEKEVSAMRMWCSLKLRYSFHALLKVIFDTDSIRNYERVFSLILKVRMVSRLLEKLWMTRSNWMMMMSSDRIFSHLRHAMHFFLSNLLYYLQVDVVDSEYSDLLREIQALQSASSSSTSSAAKTGPAHVGNFFLSSASAASTSSNDFQVILRIHKKFLANILKLSMIDHLGIQETLDRILHLCLRFIACCRIQQEQSDSTAAATTATAKDGKAEGREQVYLPSEELESIEKDFYQQISFLFQSMKTLDSRGFLFRLDFNNFLSTQIMNHMQSQTQQHQQHQQHQQQQQLYK